MKVCINSSGAKRGGAMRRHNFLSATIFLFAILFVCCTDATDPVAGIRDTLDPGSIADAGDDDDAAMLQDDWAEPDQTRSDLVRGQAPGGLVVELIDGGAVGQSGTSIAIGPDGAVYVAANHARKLAIYIQTEKESRTEFHDLFVYDPKLAVDATGAYHLGFIDPETGAPVYAVYRSGRWRSDQVDDRTVDGDLGFALGPDGEVHVAYVTQSILYYATNQTGEWDIEELTWSKYAGFYLGLAVDENGVAHIAYHSLNERAIRYATNPSGQWNSEILEFNITTPYPLSIAAGPDDRVHILYHFYEVIVWEFPFFKGGPIFTIEFEIGHQKVATLEKDTWQKRIIDWEALTGGQSAIAVGPNGRIHAVYLSSTRNSGRRFKYATRGSNDSDFRVKRELCRDDERNPALAVDPAGNVHLSSVDWLDSTLVYRSKQEGTWLQQNLAISSDVGQQNALALDRFGHPHLAYIDSIHSSVHYATDRSGHWSIQNRGTSAHTMVGTAIQVHENDTLHLAFGSKTGQVQYVQNESGKWQLESIAKLTHARISMALDLWGGPHFAVEDQQQRNIRYVTSSGGEWIFETIQLYSDWLIFHSDMALDSKGNAHISYGKTLFGSDYDLEYATNASGRWRFQTIQSGSSVGLDTSIAIDSQDAVHIAYIDATSKALKYATNADGEWYIKTVDHGSPFYARFSSIDVDPDQRAHIAYYDYDRGDLKYANNTTGEWRTCVVDAIGDVGINPHMKLDDWGRVHVSYYGEGALWYASFEQTICEDL